MTAPIGSIVWPMLAQVGLTLVLYVLLAVRKGAVVREGSFDRETAKLNPNLWPDKVVQVNNNLGNQFQSPVLFYVLCFTFIFSKQTSDAVIATAWIFVGARYAHSFVHTTSNNMKARTVTFILAMATLAALFGQLVFAVLPIAPK